MKEITTDFLKEVKKSIESRISGLEKSSDARRTAIAEAGLLWALSAAFKTFHKKDYLIEATERKDYFIKHFLDHKYGGVYHTIDEDGERLDTDKLLKAQAIAIYALSEFNAATGDDEALKAAKNIFKIIEKEFSDGRTGYAVRLSRDFSPVEGDDSLDGHIMLLEAYANLYRAMPDKDVAERISVLLDSLCDNSGAIVGDMAAEASWKMVESSFIMRDIDVINKIREVAVKIVEKNGTMAACCPECLLSRLWMWKYCGMPLTMKELKEAWACQEKIEPESGEAEFHAIRAGLGIIDVL